MKGWTLAGVPIHEDHREAFSNLGLMQQHTSSSDPQWNLSETPRKRTMRSTNSGISTDGLSDIALSEGGSPMAGAHANGHVTPAGLPLAGELLTRNMGRKISTESLHQYAYLRCLL